MELRQLFSRKRSAERSSLTGILPRVQRMRQSCEWEPVVTPEVVEERAQRVAEARKNITWEPKSFEHTTAGPQQSQDETKRLTWLLAAVLAAVCWICLWIGLAGEPANHIPGRAFTYRIGSKPPFLSEPLAVSKAWDALEENGFKPADLIITSRTTSPTEAPNGRWDEYLLRVAPDMGILQFRRRDTNETYQVSVSLMKDRLALVVSSNRLAMPPVKKQ